MSYGRSPGSCRRALRRAPGVTSPKEWKARYMVDRSLYPAARATCRVDQSGWAPRSCSVY